MTESVRRPLWVVGAALSIGAGVIHFAFGPEHVDELGLLGYGFYLSGALQVGWAAVLGFLLVRPRGNDATPALRKVAGSGIAINVAILAAWLFARVFGLPAGEMPWTPEAVGRPDTIAGILEAALILGLVGYLRHWSVARVHSSKLLALGVAVALSAIVVGTVVAISPDAMAHQDGHDQALGAIVMTMDAGDPR